ncbi:ubiquitin carboxyl-terminal hydrolase MINDY-1-like isoform X2 [Ischnura elegans]|uniref:ubiquitin carboxyl-terminal hydrolase MINDY-1-like isoform X2 n=1 Tax=Ischnura elegans TaxID=197161 RepID=UPI001ED87C33|nr:ubiquitin carboxyl-terminal hydrolase MINDY-1-like isoform X2 [Ischnura elegans]
MGLADETEKKVGVDGGCSPPDNSDKQRQTVRRSSLRLARRSSDSKKGAESIPTKRAKVEIGSANDPIQTGEEDRLGPTDSPQSDYEKLLRAPIKRNISSRVDEKTSEASGTTSKRAMYRLKWISHNGQETPVVTQNENGPCPLLSLVNILFLQGRLKIDDSLIDMTEEELIVAVKSTIQETVAKAGNPNPNLLQNAQDAITLLPEIITGLNVNIKFSGVKSFEYTRECVIFDVLGIPLYHGWLLDPQSEEVTKAVGNRSYNQLIDNIIQKRASSKADMVAEALTAENFLEATASQLTAHGLCELNSALTEGDYGILFRNNHFNVITKHKKILCQLVMDQGYLEEPNVVWETLTNLSGDEIFLDSSFQVSQRSSSLNGDEEQQISRDFLMALTLQDEQSKQQNKEFDWGAYGNALGTIGITSDEELAKSLQVLEQKKTASHLETASADESRSSSAKSSPSNEEEPPKARGWKCIIC